MRGFKIEILALDALRSLKPLAVQHDLYIEADKAAGTDRHALAREREKVVSERAAKLDGLKTATSGLKASITLSKPGGGRTNRAFRKSAGSRRRSIRNWRAHGEFSSQCRASGPK